ncbi:DUF2345 domain-containing protein, partial [Pseudomonas parafulva]|uniref:DUF2345 domain-containing protein n=1 Tax=Pseudomonas parafulva TaxID=157782 RepID=UPI0018D9FD3A
NQGIGHDPEPQQTLTTAVRELDHGANDNPNGTGTGGEPLIAVSAPAGVAVITSRSVAIAASEHIDSVAQQHQHLTAGQNIVLNAGKDVGLFAQSGDMRHIAHQGEVLVQAQHNGIRVQADQSIEVSASQQHVVVSAKEHVTLLAGGAYIRLAGGNIEFGMPGNFTVKAATHDLTGPGGKDWKLPIFKSPQTLAGDFAGSYTLVKDDERPFEGYRYQIMAGSSLLVEGLTGPNGETEQLETERSCSIQVYKSTMRDDQRITENWQANIDAIDGENPNHEDDIPLDDDEFWEAREGSDEPLGFEFQLNASEYRIRQIPHLPVEGVGVNGTFFLTGALSQEGQSLFISAMGFTAAKHMGKAHFQASVKVEVNGEQISSTPLQLGKEAEVWPVEKYDPIGSARIALPTPKPDDIVQIIIAGGYIYSAPEGRAVPIPPTGSTTIPLAILKIK